MLEEPALVYPNLLSRLVAGNLFREPGGKYRIYNKYMDLDLPGRKLIWATPVVATVQAPEHFGMKIIG